MLYGALAEAVRRESAEAVAHWWGVGVYVAWQRRKALGVGQMTEGTKALKSERLSPVLERAREAALPTLGSPERRQKIAANKGQGQAGARRRGHAQGAADGPWHPPTRLGILDD